MLSESCGTERRFAHSYSSSPTIFFLLLGMSFSCFSPSLFPSSSPETFHLLDWCANELEKPRRRERVSAKMQKQTHKHIYGRTVCGCGQADQKATKLASNLITPAKVTAREAAPWRLSSSKILTAESVTSSSPGRDGIVRGLPGLRDFRGIEV